MKLQFSHRGRQFFFITLTIEGRPPVLSRLAGEKGPPQLTALGAAARAVLLALHKVYPCATFSDHVIMPDHVHFLMIVNYDLAPTFNPLWVSFALMEAVEAAWARNGRGQAPEPPSPEAAAGLLRRTVERNRARAAEFKRLVRTGLSREEAAHRASSAAQAGCGGAVSLRFNQGPLPAIRAGCGGAAPVRSLPRFDRRAYIELSFDSRQLKAIRRYIRLNPARALWKARHPDRFRRFGNIRHAILDPARTWSAVGNLTLLGSPFLFPVRLTLRKTPAEHEPAIREIVVRAKRGEVPVGGGLARTRRRPAAHPLGLRRHATPAGTRPARRFRRRAPLPRQLPRDERPDCRSLRKGQASGLIISYSFSFPPVSVSCVAAPRHGHRRFRVSRQGESRGRISRPTG